MATPLVNSVLFSFTMFSQEDWESFMPEYSKLQKPVANTLPKKIDKKQEAALNILEDLKINPPKKRNPSAR